MIFISGEELRFLYLRPRFQVPLLCRMAAHDCSSAILVAGFLILCLFPFSTMTLWFLIIWMKAPSGNCDGLCIRPFPYPVIACRHAAFLSCYISIEESSHYHPGEGCDSALISSSSPLLSGGHAPLPCLPPLSPLSSVQARKENRQLSRLRGSVSSPDAHNGRYRKSP